MPKTIDAADRADSQLYRRGVVQSPLIRLGELPALVEKKRREAAVTTADPVVADIRNFYKVELLTRDDLIERMRASIRRAAFADCARCRSLLAGIAVLYREGPDA